MYAPVSTSASKGNYLLPNGAECPFRRSGGNRELAHLRYERSLLAQASICRNQFCLIDSNLLHEGEGAKGIELKIFAIIFSFGYRSYGDFEVQVRYWPEG